MTDLNLPAPATEEDWAALNSFGGEFGGPANRCLLDLRDRLAAVEARLEWKPAGQPTRLVWTGTAADVAPQVVPITTAEGLGPVESAPQAQQGVTVEELACILSEAPTVRGLAAGYWMLKHPRIGPLLRGEPAPAPVPVVLPEAPPMPMRFSPGPPGAFQRDGYCEAWAAARAEVARQQGGQAAPEPDAEPEPNQAPAGDHIPAATKMVPAGDGEREELVDRLGWIAAQLSDIGWECDSASVARAAVLLRQPANGWQPISTAPKDGTEILTSDYDSIELTSWNLKLDWINRDCQTVFPAWWHPLPVQPEPPQGQEVAP
jgi:hypothetical protein